MKRSPHPRRECACESRRAGALQARFEKKSPGKGTKTCHSTYEYSLETFEKKSPGKGTKTIVITSFYVQIIVIEKKSPGKGTKTVIVETMPLIIVN